MKLKMFMDAMQAIENDRKLTKEIVVSALEEALIKAYRKHIEIPDALVRVDISEKTGAIRELRARKNFEKPSMKRRIAKMKAIYVQHLRLEDEQ